MTILDIINKGFRRNKVLYLSKDWDINPFALLKQMPKNCRDSLHGLLEMKKNFLKNLSLKPL